MSKRKKSPREKSPGTAAPNGASPKGGNDDPGRRDAKTKSVAAEIGSAVRREEVSPARKTGARSSTSEATKPTQAPIKPQAATAARPVQGPTGRPSPKSETAAAEEAPRAASPSPQSPARPAPVTRKPAALQPEAAHLTRAAEAPQAGPETAVAIFERSFREARQGTLEVNRKLMDFAQANLNSGLDHVKDLAAARSPIRIMRLQVEYWHDCLETFARQAFELRALSAEFVAKTNAPIRDQMQRFPHPAA